MGILSRLFGRSPAPAPHFAPPAPLPPVLEYACWRNVPPEEWPWSFFTPRDIACRGTSRIRVYRRAMDALQALRRDLGQPLVVASGYRSPDHNAKVGGSPTSRHMLTDAFDVVMDGHDPAAVIEAAKRVGFRGFGYYPEARTPFLHIDLGPPRAWGAKVPTRA